MSLWQTWFADLLQNFHFKFFLEHWQEPQLCSVVRFYNTFSQTVYAQCIARPWSLEWYGQSKGILPKSASHLILWKVVSCNWLALSQSITATIDWPAASRLMSIAWLSHCIWRVVGLIDGHSEAKPVTGSEMFPLIVYRKGYTRDVLLL